MSNSMIKSPFLVGSDDKGIPSDGTIFLYPGLENKIK